jgi:hypothetical protein
MDAGCVRNQTLPSGGGTSMNFFPARAFLKLTRLSFSDEEQDCRLAANRGEA